MSLVLALSVLVSLLSMVWSWRVSCRLEDRRFLLLTASLMLLSVGQIWALVVGNSTSRGLDLNLLAQAKDVPGLLAGLAALMFVRAVGRVNAYAGPAASSGMDDENAAVQQSKQLTEELRLSEERHRGFIETSSEGIYLCELDEPMSMGLPEDEKIVWITQHCKIVVCNDAFARMYDYECGEQMLGMRAIDLYGTFDNEANVAMIRELIQADFRIVDQVSEEFDRNGNRVFFVNNCLGIVENGHLIRVWGTQHDVTEQTVARRKLAESEERYRRLVEHSPFCIHEIGLDGCLTSMNPAGLAMMELAFESEICGVPYMSAVSESDQERVRGLLQDALQGETRCFEFTATNDRFLESCFAPLTDSNGDVKRIMGISVDITDRKQAEMLLRDRKEELRELNASLERRVVERTHELQLANDDLEAYAHSVAHDLRAPLRAMYGFATALQEDYAEALDEQGREYTGYIESSARQMDNLIKDLLEYSRIGRGGIALGPVNLDYALRRALDQLEADITSRHAEIQIDGPLGSTIGHTSTVVQIASNLIANAIKFTPVDTPPKIKIRTEQHGSNLRLTVADNGIGVAPEFQSRIFRVFERLHGVETYPGTGIGLAIVRRAAESMSGSVGVESELGSGSRFWVELPTTSS